MRERDGKLTENWYVACLSEELKTGKPFQSTIYDRPYVLFRNPEGKAVCFPDQCLHRFSPLSLGKVKDGKLSCPYHGWTYNSEGIVVDVPSRGEKGCTPHPNLCLKPVSLVEQDGLVWVWMGEGSPTSSAPPFRLPHFHDQNWLSFYVVNEVPAEVTELISNFLDIAHTVFVHPGLFRSESNKEVPMSVKVKDGALTIDYHLKNDELGLAGYVLNPGKEPVTHTDVFTLPNTTYVTYNFGTKTSFVITSQSTPVSENKTRVYLGLFYKIPKWMWLMKPIFKWYVRHLLKQDTVILKPMAQNLKKGFGGRYHSTEADVVHIGIENLRELAKKDPEAAKKFEKSHEIKVFI